MHACSSAWAVGQGHTLRSQPSPSPHSCSSGPQLPPTRAPRRQQLVHAAPPRQQQDSAALTASGSGAASPSEGFFTPGQEGTERQRLFNTIAPVYDELNDQLSLGLHRVWKRMAVKWSGARTGAAALDVCCGSGDLAFRLAEAVGPSGSVVGLDFSAAMLADAERRQQQRRAMLGPAYNMRWVQVRGVGRQGHAPPSFSLLRNHTQRPATCAANRRRPAAAGRRHGPAVRGVQL